MEQKELNLTVPPFGEPDIVIRKPLLASRVVAAISGALLVALVLAGFSSVVTIQTGQLGVVRTFGRIESQQLNDGLHFVIPFVQRVSKVDTRVQKVEINQQTSASQDLQDVSVSLAVNYQIKPDEVTTLIGSVGTDYLNVLVLPAIQESLKATTAHFTASGLITRRAEVSQYIQEDLGARLNDFGIEVRAINITDFSFTPEFTQAIEAAQVAEQQVREAEQRLARARVEAEQQVVAAEAAAEVMRLQSEEITLELLQKQWIEQWNGELPTVLGDANMLWQMTTPLVNPPSTTPLSD